MAPAKPSPRNEQGFTLVEALIAILILVFGLIAISNLFVVAGSSNTVANHGSAATAIATEQMERLKAMPFDSLSALTGGAANAGSVTSDVTNFNVNTAVTGVGTIHTRWEITRIDGRTLFIRVRSESTGAVTGARSRAEFTVFRTCTHPACPAA